jgi:hypothetical protein
MAYFAQYKRHPLQINNVVSHKFTDVEIIFIGLYRSIYKKYANFSVFWYSAFLGFLVTIYSNLPFFIRNPYSAFYSAHFILRYYSFIFNSHFALFGGRFHWKCLDSNSDTKLISDIDSSNSVFHPLQIISW